MTSTFDQDVSEPPEFSLVQNLVTDCLDYILQKDLERVYLSAGEPPIFGQGQKRVEAPEFTEIIEEQDLMDCLEALFLDRPTTELNISFYHHSDACDGIPFRVDIAPLSDGLTETIARFRRVGYLQDFSFNDSNA